MKNFNSYITSIPYKGTYTRLPFMVCPTRDGGPQFACQGCLIDWQVYGGNVVGASVGVNMNLLGRGAAQTIKRIEAVYIDNTFNALPVYVVFPDTGYTVIALPNAVTCEAVYTGTMEANIYCDGFDGIALPLSRVLFLEHYVSSFSVVPPTAPAAATVPTIETSNHGNTGNVAAANFNANLPAGLVAGDLLVLVVATSGNSDNAGIATPAGWTARTPPTSYQVGFGNHATLGIFDKIASGAEGASVNVAYAAGNGFASYITLRADKFLKGPEGALGTSAVGNNSPQPPSLTPSWGNDINLWLAIACFQRFLGTATAFSANPASFTQVVDEPGDANQRVHIRACSRLLTASVLTPGPYTLNGNEDWGTITYAIGQ